MSHVASFQWNGAGRFCLSVKKKIIKKKKLLRCQVTVHSQRETKFMGKLWKRQNVNDVMAKLRSEARCLEFQIYNFLVHARALSREKKFMNKNIKDRDNYKCSNIL